MYASPTKDESFTMSLKVTIEPSNYKTYGLFVETLSQKQAYGISAQPQIVTVTPINPTKNNQI